MMIQITEANVRIDTWRKNNPCLKFRGHKIIENIYWSRNKTAWAWKLAATICWSKDLYHYSALPEKCNQMHCIYCCFLYIYDRMFLLVYAVPKISWSGKLLNFTEIHRKYYKKLSFSFGINLSHALWFEKFRIWFSSPGTTRGLTLLYIQGTLVICYYCVNIILLDCW